MSQACSRFCRQLRSLRDVLLLLTVQMPAPTHLRSVVPLLLPSIINDAVFIVPGTPDWLYGLSFRDVKVKVCMSSHDTGAPLRNLMASVNVLLGEVFGWWDVGTYLEGESCKGLCSIQRWTFCLLFMYFKRSIVEFQICANHSCPPSVCLSPLSLSLSVLLLCSPLFVIMGQPMTGCHVLV